MLYALHCEARSNLKTIDIKGDCFVPRNDGKSMVKRRENYKSA